MARQTRKKQKVPLYNQPAGRVALIEDGATMGATIGVDLYMPDGSVATLAALAAALGVGDGGDGGGGSGLGPLSPTLWSLIQDIPANVLEVAALSTAGLVTRQASGDWITRAIATASSSRITVTNGDGDAGAPTLDTGTDVALLSRDPQTFSGGNTFGTKQTRFGGSFSAHGTGAAVEIGISTALGPTVGFFQGWDATLADYIPLAYEAEYIRFLAAGAPGGGAVLNEAGIMQVTGDFTSAGGAFFNAAPGLEFGWSSGLGAAFLQAFNRNTAVHVPLAFASDGFQLQNSSYTPTLDMTDAGVLSLLAYGAGALITDSAGEVTAVAPGSSGNVLTSNGTTWISAAGGGGGGGGGYPPELGYAGIL